MGEFASKGLAGTALGLGIGGAALGLLNNNNGCGGLLGGLFGNGNGRNGECCEPLETKEVACLREQNAVLRSERYADAVAISAYKDTVAYSDKNDEKLQANMKEAFQAIAELDKKSAVNNTEIKCLYTTLDNKINAVQTETLNEIKCLATNTNFRLNSLKEETGAAIALEAERRCCGDRSLREYVDGHFMQGVLKLPAKSVCPRPITFLDETITPIPPREVE